MSSKGWFTVLTNKVKPLVPQKIEEIKKEEIKIPQMANVRKRTTLDQAEKSSDSELCVFAESADLHGYTYRYFHVYKGGRTLPNLVIQMIKDGFSAQLFAGKLSSKCQEILQRMLRDESICIVGHQDDLPMYAIKK